MATNESARGGGSVNNVLSGILILLAIGVILIIGYTFLPTTPLPTTWTLPTADVAKPKPTTSVLPATGGASPLTLDQINATSLAIYQATAAAVEVRTPLPNTGQGGAVTFGEKQAPERVPAGVDNVSAAEPATDAHGEKQTAPVNIQETHTCLHGQVWTDTGCHRPTPVK